MQSFALLALTVLVSVGYVAAAPLGTWGRSLALACLGSGVVGAVLF